AAAPAPAAAAPAPGPAPAPAYAPAAVESTSGNGTRGALLSPVVRRLISEHGLDAADIPGTGAGGRITREDVTGYIDQRAAAAAVAAAAPVAAPAPATSPAPVPVAPSFAPVPAPAPAAAAPVSTPPAPLGPRDEVVPFSGIRRVTAEHMVRSKATSAHTLVAVEADFENVDRVRRAHRDRFKEDEGMSLTYLPFVARAAVDVLREYPHLNSSVGDDALVVHRDVHLGIAVDLSKEGLIVPVVHNADGQSLRGLARSIADLASRARSRKLSADDIAGGTFTITNPGPYGTFMTVPIIAQPQVAILSTDGVTRKPVVVVTEDGTESIAIHSVGILALSFDHRAVDGAYAAAFMRDLASVIATRDWASEL
nr:dihydrolipoamide acetyltransferase family protein [Actinomycetota bacterium]